MWGILGGSFRSLFPELGSTQRNPLLSSLHPGSKQTGSVVCSLPGVMEQRRWGDGKPWERKLQKTPHVPRLPHVWHVQVFPFSGGRRAVGWLLVVLYWNPRSTSEGWPPLWGCSFLCWVHSEIFLRDIQVMLSCKEGPPTRKVSPGGMGWFGIPNPQVSPQPSRRRPSQLTMALFPSGCHLVCGRILWAWRREGAGLTQGNFGKGQYEEWISQARRRVFGFPRSMGHHRSWYSKCLLHCTSLWKKIVCWKVSKQTLY